MKVLIYSKVFLPVTGGIQTVVAELARGLAGKDWDETRIIEVTVVTRTRRRSDADDLLPYRLVRDPNLRRLIQFVREADIVHLAGPAMLPMLLGLAFGKPVVVEHHGYQSICPNGLLVYQPDHSLCPGYFMQKQYQMCIRCNTASLGWTRSLRSLILTFPRRWLCQKVSRNIAVSEHVCKRISLPRTSVVYHGVQDTTETLQEPSDGNALQIGSVGRLVSEKGLPILLRAAKRLDDDGADFRLTFVGDGPERANLENLVRNLGFRNRVEFLGELQGRELAEALRSVRVIVMPSQCEETAGLAAIEHMMRGGVVIASDIGGLGEIVGEAGLRFKAGDSDALYACLRDTIEISSLRASLSVAARRRAMQIFERNSMIEGHVSAYRNALHR
ncbi:MAG TPA: glycosyltransferase family 4 protein [Candidatus Dormibacteraeota bacterium]|nr:glycosyltransferase family 4 protein [Candidatus Dormibacteraeota bacterium]